MEFHFKVKIEATMHAEVDDLLTYRNDIKEDDLVNVERQAQHRPDLLRKPRTGSV